MGVKYGGAYDKAVRGIPVPASRTLLINQMYFDENHSILSIQRSLKSSRAVVERELFHTRDEYERFKRKHANVAVS